MRSPQLAEKLYCHGLIGGNKWLVRALRNDVWSVYFFIGENQSFQLILNYWNYSDFDDADSMNHNRKYTSQVISYI